MKTKVYVGLLILLIFVGVFISLLASAKVVTDKVVFVDRLTYDEMVIETVSRTISTPIPHNTVPPTTPTTSQNPWEALYALANNSAPQFQTEVIDLFSSASASIGSLEVENNSPFTRKFFVEPLVGCVKVSNSSLIYPTFLQFQVVVDEVPSQASTPYNQYYSPQDISFDLGAGESFVSSVRIVSTPLNSELKMSDIDTSVLSDVKVYRVKKSGHASLFNSYNRYSINACDQLAGTTPFATIQVEW